MTDGLLGAYFGNPNVQRQGARARALAAQRDVNLLPDPKTYAVAQGLLGNAPDQLGFSVMHPDYQEIKQVAEPAFYAGSLLQFAPPTAPVANKIAKAVGPRIEQALAPAVQAGYQRGGLTREMLEAMGSGTRSNVYLPSTPTKPDPTVGKRFTREYVGGLADKTPVKIEDYQGASALLMPWDSTSRNYKVTGISDEVLPRPVITHGGQDYARDLEHMSRGVAGASNLAIAKRIKTRDALARQENIAAGGTGEILHMPVTMGYGGEDFSAMPTEALLSLLDLRGLPKKDLQALDQSLRTFKVPGKQGQPFKNFAGVDSEEGRVQLFSGAGLGAPAGELRKALVNRLTMKKNQAKLGYNEEDLRAALTDPALAGVPKGYTGNTLILSDPSGMHLRPSNNRTYDTDFTGQYQGTLGLNVPAEVLFPDRFAELAREFSGRKADLRTMQLGALEKRNYGVSQLIDQQVIDNFYKHREQQLKQAAGLLD
jgi:hypothetical protein